MAKPELPPQQCSNADGRLSGVEEDGAVRKLIQEHERPLQADGAKGKSALAEKK